MDGILALIYVANGAIFYVGLQTAPKPRPVWQKVPMAFFWPLTLVALVVWSFLGDEDEAL